MESDNKSQRNDIKNCTLYYFDDIININELDLDNIFLDEKSHRNILIYEISYVNLDDAKTFSIIFNKVDGYIRKYDKTKYLDLFHFEKCDKIFDRIRHLFILKNKISSIFS